MSTRSLSVILAAALVSNAAFAFQSLSSAPASSGVRVEVTPQGAFLRASTAVAPLSGTQNQIAGLIWTATDGGLAWIGENVAIGNHGSEVFTQVTLNNERSLLFSAYDTNPPTPIFDDPSPLGADAHRVASADAQGIHVAMHRIGGVAVLSKYTTVSSNTPDWTFPFVPSGNNGFGVGISRDGQTIVAAVADAANSSVDVAVFSPASSTPVSYTPVPIGANPFLRGFDLSADGSTLYFSPSSGPAVTAYVFDVATTSVVFSTNIGASFDSHAISGDGSVFAFGNFNQMRVFERTGITYTNTFNRNLAGQNYVASIDISDDSSTIAYGFTFYANYLTIRVEAIDVASQTVTMTDVVTGAGSSQNIVSGVSISADGSRFAVGAWGDAGGIVDEMRLYSPTQNAPIATVDLPGSAFGIAISADGTKMAGASKAVHANDLGSGGRIDLYGDNSPFTTFCFSNSPATSPCPCGNTGVTGHGCDNSSSTGGALLSAIGTTSPDTVSLTSNGELPNVLSIFLQGNIDTSPGVNFGDGVRCTGGTLLRLYVTNADGSGSVTEPSGTNPPITAQSAALGDPITPGSSRYYQVYYRDPVLGFCSAPPGNAFNVSNAVEIAW